MTWLTATVYLHHKCPRLCSVCRNHHRVLFSCVTYHWVCSKSNTKAATSRAGTAHSSGAHVSANDFCGILVALSLVFCVIFCRLLLVLLSFYFDLCIVSPSSIYNFWSLIIGHWKIKFDFVYEIIFYCSNTTNGIGYKLIIRAIVKVNNSTLNTNLPIFNIV
jgi:hypothetical protein